METNDNTPETPQCPAPEPLKEVKAEKITLHKALGELKLIDKKIEKRIKEFAPVGINIKGKLVDGVAKEDDFRKDVTGNYDSIIQLIERKIKLKAAIVKANGLTMVKVGEKEMTIADAINRKKIIDAKKELLKTIIAKFNRMVDEMNRRNDTLNQRLDTHLIGLLGKEKASKPDDADVTKNTEVFRELNEWMLCDPINAKQTSESLDKEIDEFESEVDYALSEINSTTFIVI